MAHCYAFIDERTLALDWLEQAARQGFVHHPYLSSQSQIWRKFDADPRFQALMGDIKTTWEQLRQVWGYVTKLEGDAMAVRLSQPTP